MLCGFSFFPGTQRQVFHSPLTWSNLGKENALCLNLSPWPPRLAPLDGSLSSPPHLPYQFQSQVLKINPIIQKRRILLLLGSIWAHPKGVNLKWLCQIYCRYYGGFVTWENCWVLYSVYILHKLQKCPGTIHSANFFYVHPFI